jgi:Flp pilus assembly protein TadD
VLLVAVVISVVAGVVAGGTAFWIRRSRAVRIDAGHFVVAPTSSPATHDRADDATVFAAYARSESCVECHWEAHEFWRKSHHGLAERQIDPKLERDAFDPARTTRHGTQQSVTRLDNGKFQIVTPGSGGKVEPYEVRRAIGVWPLVQYLVEAPNGRVQATELAWEPDKRQWFNVYGEEDRKPGEWGHWTGRGMNWNAQCAACHNTRVRKNYDAAADRYTTTMAEMTVSCESCHGPMRTHVEWRHKYGNTTDEDPTIKPVDRERMFETCGSCHSRRRDLTGEFVPGDSFFDHFQLAIPDETDIFYPDGQVREEDYEFSAFLGSRMHAAGVRCVDCHHPHSSKPVLPGNLLCMRCHGGPGTGTPYPNAPVIDERSHTFHKEGSAGAQCVSCHMSVTTYMQRHGRRDHGFTVPDPLMTKELGIPNACNRCHTDKDTSWSLAAVGKWYGDRTERPNRVAARSRTRAVAAARRGDTSARDGILAMAGEKENAYWRAVVVGLLGRWAGESSVFEVLPKATRDASPLVREAAARSLSPLAEARHPPAREAMAAMLKDPARVVRVVAAWGLRADVNLESSVGRDLLASIECQRDQPAGRMQMGVLLSSRGRAAGAVAELEKAVAWSPGSAELVFSLGLAKNEAGDLDGAIASFEQALAADARHARAWYNLGLARQAKGRLPEAVAALERGEEADRSDAEIPYALARILLRQGKPTEAAAAARRALAARPGYADAQSLLNVLNGKR